MNVTSATDTARSQATSSTTTTSTNSVDYNTFLQLLVAQMKNQDPTNPMDTVAIYEPVRATVARSSRPCRPTPSWMRCCRRSRCRRPTG